MAGKVSFIVMDEDYLLATVRYIENNPVIARLCEKATQWRWSSARGVQPVSLAQK